MSYGAYSDEVAEDYRKALEDLTMNSRYEISNLTVIAKENTEHALAISEALKAHIKRTAPAKKLPAFYVLDSVVKNVGTPYTLFFGRNLYSTFMESYALVDNNVRRKMEEMLTTWKQPVPGSIDTRPVFPIEVTKPIETALIKARTLALQAQQEYARSSQQSMMRGRPGASAPPFRDTPTPPMGGRQPQFPGHAYNIAQDRSYPTPTEQEFRATSQTPQQYASQQYPRPASATPSWQQPAQTQDASIDTLNSDIARLITMSKNDFAQNPYDSTIQTRLKALLDLQSILQSQRLPPDQIAAIRDQVTKLASASQPVPRPTPPPAPVVHQPPTQQPTLSSLLGGQAGLAALLAKSAAIQQRFTPPPQPASLVLSPPTQNIQPSYTPVPRPVSATPPVPDTSSLLERLRAAGVLPPAPAAPQSSHSTPVLSNNYPAGLPQPPPFLSAPTAADLANFQIPNDVELKPASLKIPRPHLIALLYDRLGAPCTQCGRRFKADEIGKSKKTAHMDWHFRVHQRMADAEKRGQHRSWYVDELDWIKSRETGDDAVNSSGGPAAESGPVAKTLVQHWIPVPENPPNVLCPICQEKFEMKWLDDAQEFVWMDATEIGDRIYHFSCHAEARGDGGNTPALSRGTPDSESILGKRKNEDDHMSLRTKIKTEPAY